MKGIIMAGGEGSRLRPLTCDLPKPMVTIMNKPVMTYSIELLKRYNISDIGVTLQYLPYVTQNYYGSGIDYGVRLEYFIEEKPLGTAGSVKNGEAFLDETFVVISGDALTDIDLSEAINFHRAKGAMATLVLKRVAIPLEYGVVITNREDEVTRFLEKPNWGEVFSDTVNTGIYILEPEVLEYIEPETKFDFSKDLFPILLKKGQPIYGYVTDEYWCDIGNPETYLKAHFDVLDGKIGKIDIDGELHTIGRDIWIGKGCDIHPTTVIEAPCFIGEYNHIGANVRLGPYTVMGRHNIVEEASDIAKTIIWDNTTIGRETELKGASICNKVRIQRHARIYENTVIADGCCIGEATVVKPFVKIWPSKKIGDGMLITENIVWGSGSDTALFTQDGIIGQAIMDINPQFATRLGSAYGSILKSGSQVGIGGDNNLVTHMIKYSLISGMLLVGLEVFDFGQIPTSVLRYSIGKLGLDGGIRILIQDDGHINIQLMGEKGINILPDEERKIQNLFLRDDFYMQPMDKIKNVKKIDSVLQFYKGGIINSVDKNDIKALKHRIFIEDRGLASHVLGDILKDLGCIVEYGTEIDKTRNFSGEYGYDMGIELSDDGERIVLYDERGRDIRDEKLFALISLICLKQNKGCSIVVPHTAPSIIEDIAKKYTGRVIRTKTSKNIIMEAIYANMGKKDAENIFKLYFDYNYMIVKLLGILSRERTNLSNLVSEIPNYYMKEREIDCPWEWKGRIIRSLIEDDHLNSNDVELDEGIKVKYKKGWVLVLPDNDSASCRLYSQGYTEEYATELADFYEKKIRDIRDDN